MGSPLIRKSSGAEEPFDPGKLRRSLESTGASPEEVDQAMTAVERRLRQSGGRDLSTRAIFQVAHRALRRAHRPAAARYNLRRAVERLGPSGFPFEHFYGELLRAEGWEPRVGVVLEGRFVNHEVDVDATRDGERRLCECKFRRDQRSKIDVRIALYVFARSEDLRSITGGYTSFQLVTNGRFTSDALRYGEGVGLQMIAWDHPRGGSLRDRIEQAALHPITCLTDLRRNEQRKLLDRGTVLCRQLAENPSVLEPMDIPHQRKRRIRRELEGLLQLQTTGKRVSVRANGSWDGE